MASRRSAAFAAAIALVALGAVAWLLSGGSGRDWPAAPRPAAPPERAEPAPARETVQPLEPEAPAPAPALPVRPEPAERSGSTPQVGGRGHAEHPADVAEFRAWAEARAAAKTERGYLQLLRRWRTGTLSREREHVLDDVIGAAGFDAALDAAAARLLLQAPPSPDQRLALARLLASSGSDVAVDGLLAAAVRADLAAEATRALATVADPGALPRLRQAVTADADPELLRAIDQAARNIDTPKARDLEREIEAVRDR